MRIARVFPRKTNASPTDALAFFDAPGLFPPKVDEVHISVAFTWDMPRAEQLAKEWERIAPVKIGGPATGQKAGAFTPGMYLSPGHTITSRGCPNSCWFCKVPKRQGDIVELPIQDGWIVTDDNILACPRSHFFAVVEMLKRQPEPAQFKGGLEAAQLQEWHVAALRSIRTGRLYFAYDTPDDLAPLQRAGEMLRDHGFTMASHKLCAYVLCGWKGDTMEKAERRMWETVEAGFMPYAMLYRDDQGLFDATWRRFQRAWIRPEIVATKVKEAG